MGDEGPSVKRAYKTVTWIIPMRVATIGRILYADNATCAIKSLARTNNMKYLQGQAVAPPELKNVGSEPNSDRRDRLHYLADMVRELQTIAEREGCTTLAGLLWLSHTEATLQADKPS